MTDGTSGSPRAPLRSLDPAVFACGAVSLLWTNRNVLEEKAGILDILLLEFTRLVPSLDVSIPNLKVRLSFLSKFPVACTSADLLEFVGTALT